MARARNIKPGFYLNEQLAGCSLMARFIFPGLWMHADRAGRLEDRPLRLKAALLPYDNADINALLDELNDAKLIVRYQIGESKYVQILTFDKHQNPHINEPQSKIPAPYNSGASTIQAQCENNSAPADSLIPDSLIPDSLSNPTAACAAVPTEFDRFWKTWPKSDRKVDKAKCLKAWGKNRLDPIAEQVIAHVEAMKASEQWLSGFEPAPLKYLNGKRWLDPLPERNYLDQELRVISAYNDILTPAGWPEAVADPYSRERALAISEFLTFSTKPNWVEAYFSWLCKSMPAKLGYGFEWAIGRESYIRAKEGNFRALQEAA